MQADPSKAGSELAGGAYYPGKKPAGAAQPAYAAPAISIRPGICAATSNFWQADAASAKPRKTILVVTLWFWQS